MFVAALAIASIGIAIAVRITDFENFGTIQNFITLPLYLFSGAVFPTRGVPGWLNGVLVVNPLTYGVEALRAALFSAGASTATGLSVTFSLGILGLFALVMFAAAFAIASRRRTLPA